MKVCSMSDQILNAFEQLKKQLDTRNYDDERFIKDLPHDVPVSLVIPFERTGQGYLNIFRTYIKGNEHPELSDSELLKLYLHSSEGQKDNLWGKSVDAYVPDTFRGVIEDIESFSSQKNRFSQEEVTNLITALRANGINAVSKQDEKSQDPSTVVVLNNGIITPFMDKESVSTLVPQIKQTMFKCGFAVGGHISPITFEQLRSPLEVETAQKEDLFTNHFIDNFIKKRAVELTNLAQLQSSNEKISIGLIGSNVLDVITQENDASGRPYIWRGGILGDKAFIANIDTENFQSHALRKSWGMATPDINYALGYAARGGQNFKSGSSFECGFLYQYDTSGEEVYLGDRGIERHPTSAVLKGKEETPLFPYKHTLKNIYFYYANEKGECYLMRMDKNNPIHRRLLKNHEPKDTRISGNLKERRIRQFEEAKANGGQPNTVSFSHNKATMKNLEEQISRKLQELRDKSSIENIEDVPHLKTQVLRTVGENNLGKPKRSKAEKEIVKSAIEKAIQNTK